MRLDRLVSSHLLISRKDAKTLIRSAKVLVNDKVARSEGLQVNLSLDKVIINNELVEYREFYYLLLNKPAGYVCANNDNVNPTVFDYLAEYSNLDLHTVGRLDKDTTGVLLLTNNGKLTHNLISPKKNIDKTYLVEVDRPLDEKLITLFKNGLNINNEYVTLPSRLEILSPLRASLTINEGKYHQVKRMFISQGYNVIKLHRSSFFFLTDEGLNVGEYRFLSKDEEEKLFL